MAIFLNLLYSISFTLITFITLWQIRGRKMDYSAIFTWGFFQLKFTVSLFRWVLIIVNFQYYSTAFFFATSSKDISSFDKANQMIALLADLMLNCSYFYFVYEIKYVYLLLSSSSKDECLMRR